MSGYLQLDVMTCIHLHVNVYLHAFTFDKNVCAHFSLPNGLDEDSKLVIM